MDLAAAEHFFKFSVSKGMQWNSLSDLRAICTRMAFGRWFWSLSIEFEGNEDETAMLIHQHYITSVPWVQGMSTLPNWVFLDTSRPPIFGRFYPSKWSVIHVLHKQKLLEVSDSDVLFMFCSWNGDLHFVRSFASLGHTCIHTFTFIFFKYPHHTYHIWSYMCI